MEILLSGLISIAERLLNRPLNENEKEVAKEVAKAIDHAQREFHKRFGDGYGASGSTFIDRERNHEKLLRSTFARGERLNAVDLDLEGFDGSPKVSTEAATFFLDAFYHTVDQTTSRTLDRDLAFQEGFKRNEAGIQFIRAQVDGIDRKLETAIHDKILPARILNAIAEPSLEELAELIKTGLIQKALTYAERHIKAIDTALKEEPDPDYRHLEVLRPHRQRLLFAAARAASLQGHIEAGCTFWWRARDLGPIDPEWYDQAATVVFNAGLEDEFRYLAGKMRPGSEVFQRTAPLLAFLDEDWNTVDTLLSNTHEPDLILLRVQAQIRIIDPKDVNAVKVTSDLLDLTDSDTTLPVFNLKRVQLTLELLKRVLFEYTPLDYNRGSLIDKLISRLNVALNTTDSDSLFRAQVLGYFDMAAALLRDDELKKQFNSGVAELPDNIRSTVFFSEDPSLSVEKIDDLLAKGRITLIQSIVFKAKLFRESGQLNQIEDALYRTLYVTSDKREKLVVLLTLLEHLRQTNQTDEIQRLIDTTTIRPADRWVLRAEHLPPDKSPLDLIDEVKEFPLDVDVIELIAKFTHSTVTKTSLEDSSHDSANLKSAQVAVQWHRQLMEVLPSRSSKLKYAQALYDARCYAELLSYSHNLDPIYAEQISGLEAFALVGLNRRSEAINRLISASETYPESIYFVEHAAYLLLIENRPKEAENLLESHIASGSKKLNILLLYAQSIHNQAPNSQDHASRAFDSFAQAYDLQPAPDIAFNAWNAARIAGREQEAHRFFTAFAKDAIHVTADTADDIIEAVRTSEGKIIRFDKSLEALAELVRRDREASKSRFEFLSVHTLSYVDFFRLSKQSWEFWSYWTQQFERRSAEEKITLGEFSVLSEWPSLHPKYDYVPEADKAEMFLDKTAILTLGVLGPEMAEQTLIALGTSYVHSGILEELYQDLRRITGHLSSGEAASHEEVIDFLTQNHSAVVDYSQEIKSATPSDSGLGPCRVDLGVAILNDAIYVTDLDNSDDWTEEVNRLRISSAVLLSSLNADGKIEGNKAREAAKKYPNTFEGWDTVTPHPIPEILVFDEYSILDWARAGLANVLGDRIKIGPWAWKCISEKSEYNEAMGLAHERVKNTIDVLKAAFDNGILVETGENEGNGIHGETSRKYECKSSNLEESWSSALKSIRVAHSRGFQLWADDRFYTLLLGLGGPMKMGPDVQTICSPFVAWADSKPPISTMELLNQLSSTGRLSSTVAQDAAAKLFSHGYRMAHPLLLAHALRQYPIPASSELTPPFEKLVHAITEVPHYLPEKFNDFYGNRNGFIRAASMGVAERLIIGVWEAKNLTNDERYVLANKFLGAVEQVFEEVSPKATESQSDLTRISFWRGMISGLQTIQIQDQYRLKLRYDALRWLGKAVVQRNEQREAIVRLLEDSVLDSLKYVHKALQKSGEIERLSQAVAAFVVPRLTPLTDTDLINTLNPLMRRTIGFLARLDRDGRINTHFYATSDKESTLLEIPEEQKEQVAADVVGRVVAGELDFKGFIYAADVAFSYPHQVPESWINAGFPSDEDFRIKVRCSLFTLLWNGLPELQENLVHLIIYTLSFLDPALAYKILLEQDELLSDNPNKVRESRNRLAIELLQSGFFDLQRELVHAVQRFRDYDTKTLSQFIGWIGEDASQALADHPLRPDVWQIGSLLVPRVHLIGRALLTDLFDDGHLVLENFEQLIGASDDLDKQNAAVPKLTEWLGDKVRAAENADDPFVAAGALRAVLLCLSRLRQDHKLNINGHLVKVSDWTTNYLGIALAPNAVHPSEIEQRMIDRRRLASAALLLASFICSGYKHREAYSQGKNPHAMWLEHVWLMATKLQLALIGLRGGLSNAAEIASKAVRELELDTPEFPTIDAFDPYAFGLNGDDIGIALTLTAMLKAANQLPDSSERPIWWTDTIQSLVAELAGVGSDKILQSDEKLDNHFGLVAPFRVRIVAQQLIKSLSISR